MHLVRLNEIREEKRKEREEKEEKEGRGEKEVEIDGEEEGGEFYIPYLSSGSRSRIAVQTLTGSST